MRSDNKLVMDEQLERLQDRDGRFSAVVRLVHCITGPRLRRQYFVGTEVAVSLPSGRYLDSSSYITVYRAQRILLTNWSSMPSQLSLQ